MFFKNRKKERMATKQYMVTASRRSQLGHGRAGVPWKGFLNMKMLIKEEHFRKGTKVILLHLHFCISVGGLHKAFQTLFMESFASHSIWKAREEKVNMRNEGS